MKLEKELREGMDLEPEDGCTAGMAEWSECLELSAGSPAPCPPRTPRNGGAAADQHRRPGPMLHRRHVAVGRAEHVCNGGSGAEPGGE